MPIPNKKIGEKQKDYMMRCVPQLMIYHDKSEAIAICYKSFDQDCLVGSNGKYLDKYHIEEYVSCSWHHYLSM